MPLVCGLGFCARMINVLHREVKLVFVSFGIAAELAAAVSQHAQQFDIVLLKERQPAGLYGPSARKTAQIKKQ